MPAPHRHKSVLSYKFDSMKMDNIDLKTEASSLTKFPTDIESEFYVDTEQSSDEDDGTSVFDLEHGRNYPRKGPIVKFHSGYAWHVTGVSEVAPKMDVGYFARPFPLEETSQKRHISVCIPCYNEEADALKRTLRSFHQQKSLSDFNLEIVIIMDGIQKMSDSMCTYVNKLFGIHVHPTEAGDGIFQHFKGAETVILQLREGTRQKVDRDDEVLTPVSSLNLSLILKKNNQRKVNSHMWWLGAHAPCLTCEFVLATDCGIVFEKNAVARLVERLDGDKDLAAVTGFQRVMPSDMQGDGPYEVLNNPIGHLLRQIQRYDFELDQSITKSAFDSVGFMPVLPGPCGLYRFSEWGNLEHGVMQEYFSLVHKPVESIVFGNVQLAEDRIPSCLLVFRNSDPPPKSRNNAKDTARPKTGFVHNSIFYFEAEKPLGQLVKQRRRWLNGTYAAYLWVHQEGWVWRGGHHYLTKLFVAVFVLINLVQGAFVRLCGPAVTAVGIYVLCQILPEVTSGDSELIVQAMLDDSASERATSQPLVTAGSLVVSTMYIVAYAIFVVGHTPRAVPVCRKNPTGQWRPDKRSAYRPRLFAMAFIVNVLVVLFFLSMSILVVHKVNWKNIPTIVKAMVSLPLIPYTLVFLDGVVNNPYPDLTSFWNVLKATPHYLLSSLWFSIWLPAYATARMSDLSWGNRDTIDGQGSDDVVAKHRARIGQRTAIVLVCCNAATTLFSIAAIYTMPTFIRVMLILMIFFMGITFAMSIIDMTLRILRRLARATRFPSISSAMGYDKDSADSKKTEHRASSPSTESLSKYCSSDTE